MLKASAFLEDLVRRSNKLNAQQMEELDINQLLYVVCRVSASVSKDRPCLRWTDHVAAVRAQLPLCMHYAHAFPRKRK